MTLGPAAQDMLSEARFYDPTGFCKSSRKLHDCSLALEQDAFDRCQWLDMIVTELSKSNGTFGRSLLSIDEGRMVEVLDDALRDPSDETTMTLLRHASPVFLRVARVFISLNDPNSNEQQLTLKPRHADLEIAFSGEALCSVYERGADGEKLNQWFYRLMLARSEQSVSSKTTTIPAETLKEYHQELPTRLAAACAMAGFASEIRKKNTFQDRDRVLLWFYLALYDTLGDDDEDVRDRGAGTVSLLFANFDSSFPFENANNLSLSPPAAKSRLRKFLEQAYNSSKALWTEAVERLTGVEIIQSPQKYECFEEEKTVKMLSDLQLIPVSQLLPMANGVSNVIFAEEKQNLYIDTAREVDEWAATMMRLNSSARVPSVLTILETWTVKGLTYLIELFEERIDEPLSPTSLPEAYTLWTRVIDSAGVIVRTSTPASGKGKAKAKENMCKILLKKLMELNRVKTLHPLLIERVRCILEGIKHPALSI